MISERTKSGATMAWHYVCECFGGRVSVYGRTSSSVIIAMRSSSSEVSASPLFFSSFSLFSAIFLARFSSRIGAGLVGRCWAGKYGIAAAGWKRGWTGDLEINGGREYEMAHKKMGYDLGDGVRELAVNRGSRTLGGA